MHGNSLSNSLQRLYVHKKGYVHIKNIFQIYVEETRIKNCCADCEQNPFLFTIELA